MSASGRSCPDPILQFYRQEGADSSGRTLEEIWAWGYGRLETVHDYIQWLFPLQQESSFNPDAPLLTEDTVNSFLDDDVLKRRLKRSFELMLSFYGLDLIEPRGGRARVMAGPEFPARSRQWVRAGDHNHLRLSRIMASLRVLGLAAYSRALLDCLIFISEQHPDSVTAVTLNYWKRAASGEEDG